MNRLPILISVFVLAITSGCLSLSKYDAELNQLSSAEKKAGFKLLFDGKSLAGWRNYKKPDAPKQGWVVENGCLKLLKNGGGGDIVTVEKFTDYDLRWEWKIPAMANNGLKYLVSENRSAPGPEYQMIDDAVQEPPHRSTATLYDILPKTKNSPTRTGEWNHSRIVVQGNHVEHWLNGKKVLAYELGSPELKAAIARSKFKNIPDFGDKSSGHILLTDHHDEAFYRNIKIRALTNRLSGIPAELSR